MFDLKQVFVTTQVYYIITSINIMGINFDGDIQFVKLQVLW